jgi:protein-L-isoaspartate(D-aspartate) O-methyltransferase
MSGRIQDFAADREKMVAQQIEGRGIRDAALLAAMRAVPRHCFVDEPYREYAYSDAPLPIPAQQTISQPYVVALMISALELTPDSRVLEVGTGSGYAAALLSRMVEEVVTVERHLQLVEYARARLERLGYANIRVFHGDGTLGNPEHAPYDGIIVAAGGPEIPVSLQRQLALGGRLVMPVGRRRRQQQLICLWRVGAAEFITQELGPVAFVPLIGSEGWKP